MCTFCHAPEPAYNILLEDEDIDLDGLCPEAFERLHMAATPPPEDADLLAIYAWDEDHHAWERIIVKGQCNWCDRATWKAPRDMRTLVCARCTRGHVDAYRELVRDLNDDDPEPWAIDAIMAMHPERRLADRFGRLCFSNYEVPHTRDFDGIPGPRTYERKSLRWWRS